MALGGGAAAVTAAIATFGGEAATRGAAVSARVAAALALGGLIATAAAAPIMLSIRRIPDADEAALRRAFTRFARTGGVRSALQVLSFVAELWALAAVGAVG